MLHLANFCLFALLFVNLLGLTLITGLWLREAWLALTVGPWLFCTVGFFVETFHGFGVISWTCPFLTIISVALLLEVTGKTAFLRPLDKRLDLDDWKRKLSPLLVPLPYYIFIAVFIYAMLWRYRFPNIDGDSEKICDLALLGSYFSGETIPVHDTWLSPFLSTFYYSFQFYAAALMARILGIDAGTAYNLGFATLIGMTGTAGIGAVCLATRKLWIRILISTAWVAGGSGATGIFRLIAKDANLWDQFRFIGGPQYNIAPLGTFLAEHSKHWTAAGLEGPLNLPGEPMSYLIYLGDYHPPLAGFYLLALGLLGLNLWAKGTSPWILSIVGATLPWCLVADMWNLPLEVLGLGAWGVYQVVKSACLNIGETGSITDPWEWSWVHFIKYIGSALFVFWSVIFALPKSIKGVWTSALRYILLGAAAGMVAVFPYYRLFAVSAGAYQTTFTWVPWNQHTPPLLWLLFFLPTVGIAVLGLFARNRVVFYFSLLWLCYLYFSEFFFINDIYSGQFLRFNTTLKWWPWITSGALLTLAPRLLDLTPKRVSWFFLRSGALFLVAYPLIFIWDLGYSWYVTPSTHVGQLDGSGFITVDPSNNSLNDPLMLNYLRRAPKGVVVEHPGDDFSNYGAMTVLSGQTAYIGWLGHEQFWRGYLPEIQYRYDHLQDFYNGKMSHAGEWMRSQGIDYILWFKDGTNPLWLNHGDSDQLWDTLNTSLQPQYTWHEFYHLPTRRIGLWEKSKPAN